MNILKVRKHVISVNHASICFKTILNLFKANVATDVWQDLNSSILPDIKKVSLERLIFVW